MTYELDEDERDLVVEALRVWADSRLDDAEYWRHHDRPDNVARITERVAEGWALTTRIESTEREL